MSPAHYRRTNTSSRLHGNAGHCNSYQSVQYLPVQLHRWFCERRRPLQHPVRPFYSPCERSVRVLAHRVYWLNWSDYHARNRTRRKRYRLREDRTLHKSTVCHCDQLRPGKHDTRYRGLPTIPNRLWLLVWRRCDHILRRPFARIVM